LSVSPIIRFARETDVPAVVTLVTEVLAEFGLTFGVGATTDAALAQLPGSYAEHGGAFWVVDDGGAIVGTCGLFPVDPPEDAAFELRKMYLARRVRGRGVGQRLLDEAFLWLRARGAHRVVLDTTEQMHRAIAFYETNGFVRDDTQRRGARCSRGYAKSL
jgi:putative acetyltransferase